MSNENKLSNAEKSLIALAEDSKKIKDLLVEAGIFKENVQGTEPDQTREVILNKDYANNDEVIGVLKKAGILKKNNPIELSDDYLDKKIMNLLNDDLCKTHKNIKALIKSHLTSYVTQSDFKIFKDNCQEFKQNVTNTLTNLQNKINNLSQNYKIIKNQVDTIGNIDETIKEQIGNNQEIAEKISENIRGVLESDNYATQETIESALENIKLSDEAAQTLTGILNSVKKLDEKADAILINVRKYSANVLKQYKAIEQQYLPLMKSLQTAVKQPQQAPMTP